jgi:hypothetical protein
MLLQVFRGNRPSGVLDLRINKSHAKGSMVIQRCSTFSSVRWLKKSKNRLIFSVAFEDKILSETKVFVLSSQFDAFSIPYTLYMASRITKTHFRSRASQTVLNEPQPSFRTMTYLPFSNCSPSGTLRYVKLAMSSEGHSQSSRSVQLRGR